MPHLSVYNMLSCHVIQEPLKNVPGTCHQDSPLNLRNLVNLTHIVFQVWVLPNERLQADQTVGPY